MSAHAKPSRRLPGEAILAAYSHARSGPLAEWLYVHPGSLAAAAVVLLALLMTVPVAALIAAAVLVGVATVVGLVLSLQEASGTCDRIIREVLDRESGSDGAE